MWIFYFNIKLSLHYDVCVYVCILPFCEYSIFIIGFVKSKIIS